MKITIIVLLVLIGVVLAQSNDLFVNFQPRTDSGCQGDVAGVGYATSINECLELPSESYYFIVTALRAGWKIYDDSTKCSGNWTDDSYKNGTCIENLQFIQAVDPTPYATMFISQAPITQIDNAAIMAMYSDASCELDALVAYSYATNGTEVTSDDSTSVAIICQGDQPTSVACEKGCSGTDCCKTYDLSTSCKKSDKYYIKTTYDGNNSNANTSFLKSTAKLPHPIATLFHILFKVLSIMSYLFPYLFGNGFIISFILCTLLLSFDFWAVKNVTGRLLVGLRWWNEVREDGTNEWYFEQAPSEVKYNSTESMIFWLSLYFTPVLWLLFFLSSLISLNFNWLIITIIAMSLGLTNLYGYIKCARGNNSPTASSLATSYIGQAILSRANSYI
ncbi:hypothetical protein PPL_04411 [Heterostelium album PN500]|uniref:Golgi apparatus membrane protein TVP23 homolog n=1 Tax=Heterostelium pallidum (strain ATCC 26659 / Pp 5 / PN500) TaxID=670386 RepID=D3B7H3_HETP5|nr:hypothetical protein PPL_04411 [Heterostelium album PN500]EFA82716.1 hypothetical protein PPL_04411 [Heterostelium album PN500]|eukprot:XP_020434833.1 hypothetical protein PPL_04411 [Heterostelium album PN500]